MLNEIFHYGTPRHSGRYPYGSGDNPYQHETTWQTQVRKLKEQGLSEVEVAAGMGMTTTEFRKRVSIEKAQQRAADEAYVAKLIDKGYSNSEIGRMMGKNESSIRNLRNSTLSERNSKTEKVAEILKKNVDEKKFIDIGPGVEGEINLADSIGVTRNRLKVAVAMLKEQGYTEHKIYVEQLGTKNNKTTVTVLAPPGTEYKDVVNHKDQIKTVTDYSKDGGETFKPFQYPVSVDSKRIKIRYNEEGGLAKDGVIELKRNVPDLSLGKSRYAQVRIAVDDTHFLKGMAMYGDNKDFPPGVDIIFNTNKHVGTPMKGEKDNTVLKILKDDKDNPFGASIKPPSAGGQTEYLGKDGKMHLSAINKVNDEGDWGEWSKTLASQVLSKQTPLLAKKQLDLAYSAKKAEFDEISELTNPEIKRKLLLSFADDCDASAVHLKAAALPRQATHAILPITTLKPNETYAPNYTNGEQVILIRYPHAGTFEIPVLRVNNNNAQAKKLLGNAKDAIGIHSSTAEILSGADFDGDTVLVIPTRNVKGLNVSAPLKGLQGFDPKEEYKGYEGMTRLTENNKQIEMGKITNLITDMTFQGATAGELTRAVKHSMVIIDAEKHNLDYKRSFEENNIAELKAKYQGGVNKGASTLISRAKSKAYVDARKQIGSQDYYTINPKTGEKEYVYTGETYTKTKTLKDGTQKVEVVKRQQETTKMDKVKDAYELSSGTPMESIYADYANHMKALGNTARKEYINTPPTPKRNPSATRAYEKEVSSLESKLNTAIKNAPRERQAQILANTMVDAIKKDNPGMGNSELSKIKGQRLAIARERVGAKKERISITDREWEAIQAGAISPTQLRNIINNTDMDRLKELATPRQEGRAITTSMKSRAKAMAASGKTTKEIADALGISTSSVSKIIK